MKSKIAGILAFALTLILLPGISGARTLNVVNFGGDVPGITSLDRSFDPDSYSVITQIFDSLVHVDLDGKRVPGLATSWKLVDKTTYEFTLRKGVKFHNGEAFDAQSVKFTYEAVVDPATKSGNAWILGTIKSVEVVDPYKVRIKLNHPDGMFLFRLAMFGSIAPARYVQEVGLQEFYKKPVGTGPFKFVSWEKGKEIVLEKNPDYWQAGVPNIDKLVFKIIPEDKWLEALEKGEVDLITSVSPDQLEAVKSNPDIKAMNRLVLQGYWVELRNKGPLADVKVRQALNYAVDKTKMIQMQGAGMGIPLASLGKVGEIGKDPSLRPYPHDPEKAKALLKEAGQGGGFTIKALCINYAKPLAKSIMEDLEKVGVKVDMEFVSRPEWAKRVVVGKITGNPYDGDMAINLVDNPVVNLAFHAGLFLASPSPWSLMNDPEFDKKYQWALFMADLKQHVTALKALDKYIHENAMMLFTFQPERIFAMKKDVSIPGIGINGHVDYDVFSKAK